LHSEGSEGMITHKGGGGQVRKGVLSIYVGWRYLR
jgi:hypothetical protein